MKSQPLLYYAEQVGAGSGQLISSLIHQILGSKKKMIITELMFL